VGTDMGTAQSRDAATSVVGPKSSDRSHMILQQEQRRLAFLEARRASSTADSYIFSVIALPSPSRPWPAAGPDSATWAPISLQMAQRRLAFALTEIDERGELVADTDALTALGHA
jgi:hypothetical protein